MLLEENHVDSTTIIFPWPKVKHSFSTFPHICNVRCPLFKWLFLLKHSHMVALAVRCMHYFLFVLVGTSSTVLPLFMKQFVIRAICLSKYTGLFQVYRQTKCGEEFSSRTDKQKNLKQTSREFLWV